MKKSPCMLSIALFVGLIVVLFFLKRGSGYTLSPVISSSDLATKGVTGEAIDMMKLPYQLQCVPGPKETASPYTKSLTPGGYCGIQEFVKNQANYMITGGIGESLLA